MGLFWAHSADFSPRRGDPCPFADAAPISPLNRRPPEHEATASALKHQLVVLPIRWSFQSGGSARRMAFLIANPATHAVHGTPCILYDTQSESGGAPFA
jgi:hypothetical protein